MSLTALIVGLVCSPNLNKIIDDLIKNARLTSGGRKLHLSDDQTASQAWVGLQGTAAWEDLSAFK